MGPVFVRIGLEGGAFLGYSRFLVGKIKSIYYKMQDVIKIRIFSKISKISNFAILLVKFKIF